MPPNSTTTRPALTPGQSVTVYGTPGVVVQVDTDSVLVQLANEKRLDWWALEQVEAVAS